MSEILIRPATIKDADEIASMLSQLAGELGSSDYFFCTTEAIKRYGFCAKPCFHCFVAEGKTAALGLALFFPIFSTNRAKPGVYVQDLWISSDARGLGLGRRMLAEVAITALPGGMRPICRSQCIPVTSTRWSFTKSWDLQPIRTSYRWHWMGKRLRK